MENSAEKLDRIMHGNEPIQLSSRVKQSKTISITSGKGGVGKTNSCVNLGICLAKMGKKVLLIDSDFGLANIDILLNIKPAHTIESLVRDRVDIEDVITSHPDPKLSNLKIICSSSGIPEMTDVNSDQMKYIISKLAALQRKFDFLLLDTGAGISQNVLRFNAAVSEIIVISTTEPTSLRDAYAIMKVLHNNHQRNFFNLIVSQASEAESKKVRETFACVAANNMLEFEINLLGGVAHDPKLIESVRSKTPIVQFAPQSPSSLDYIRIARTLCGQKAETAQTPGNESRFWKRFFQYSQTPKSA